jgi:hypothetical protein
MKNSAAQEGASPCASSPASTSAAVENVSGESCDQCPPVADTHSVLKQIFHHEAEVATANPIAADLEDITVTV